MNELLKKYVEEFGECPPKLIMTSYDDAIYQNLLKRALKNNKPITKRIVSQAYRNYKIDR